MTNLVDALTYRARVDGELIIATHDGRVHADELLAIATLEAALPVDVIEHIRIIRTRDPDKIAHAHIAIDVNGPCPLVFDHHGSDNLRHANGIPYAACGLVLEAVEPDNEIRQQLFSDLFYTVEWNDNTCRGECVAPNWNLKSDQLAWVSMGFPLDAKDKLKSEKVVMDYFLNSLKMVKLIYANARHNARIKITNRDFKFGTPKMIGDFIVVEPSYPWPSYLTSHPAVKGVVICEGQKYVIKPARDGAVYRCLPPTRWYGHESYDLFHITNIQGVTYCSNSGHMVICQTMSAVQQAIRKFQ